ncbi:PREDICTED: uncharacterized protein LOC104812203 isoform X2 [Tarenaya hassleriana]|uniref:uncharacterized protein LOC104812203 isoform X2 n=1 Tax=Tarenaya hassleriana TaxID=28532 RepID=UPI00053CA356|nr:PREDICTED: uncharacterized protein LOC104812203 isoform X2 [Tarenaya hassleriana]
MDKESKGIAWFGHIYQKLEAVFVEVDNFAAQTCIRVPVDDQGLGFVSDEPKEDSENCSSGAVDMQQCHGDLTLPSCSDPSDENLEISKCTFSDERVDGNGSNEKLSEAVLSDEETRPRVPSIGNNNETGVTSLCLARPASLQDIDRRVSDDSQSNSSSTEAQLICSSSGRVRTEVPRNDSDTVCSSGHTLIDSNLVQVVTEAPAVIVIEDMVKKRPIISIGNQDFGDDENDAAPLETIELYDMADREELSAVDDAALYAVHHRTRKLRSFKKIADALAPKRQREKEYERIAIWFGDASMGSDLDNTKRPPAPEEDSDWQLL